ncbi:paladin-like, partial [Hypanus sabinus]|uniref:paladin-like n=1 Tax=Hypanus sabinus TaxID=79690 RepID=UPI0028C3FE78
LRTNLKEEFQVHDNFHKAHYVTGSMNDSLPEHYLVQGKYFMINDINDKIDVLLTLKSYGAPNFRPIQLGYSVYGMGQTTLNGFQIVLQKLKEEGNQEIIYFNVREEPVIFLHQEDDFVPYTPRDHDDLQENLYNLTSRDQVENLELIIKNELLDFAVLSNKVYFVYHGTEQFVAEPLPKTIENVEDVRISEEVYRGYVFTMPYFRYKRLPLPVADTLEEADFDAFISTVRESREIFSVPDVYTGKKCIQLQLLTLCVKQLELNELRIIREAVGLINRTYKKVVTPKDCPNIIFRTGPKPPPALLFSCQTGIGRSNLGMVIGALIIAHRTTFPQMERLATADHRLELNWAPLSEVMWASILKRAIQVAISTRAQELTVVLFRSRPLWVEMTSEVHYKSLFPRAGFLPLLVKKKAQRHFGAGPSADPRAILTLKKAGLPEQMLVTFYRCTIESILTYCISVWYLSCTAADRRALQRVVSSAQKTIGTQLPALEDTYSSRCLRKATSIHDLRRFTRVLCLNLREEAVLHADGQFYSLREASSLQQEIIIPAITVEQLEEVESASKMDLLSSKHPTEIWQEETKEMKQFSSCLTLKEFYSQAFIQYPQLQYQRIPITDCAAPTEEEFDTFLSVIRSNLIVDQNTVIVLNCRNGKGRTTAGMAISLLLVWHIKGFPEPTVEDMVSIPDAKYTKGEFEVILSLVRILPNGDEMKKEVDRALDAVSDSMTPMMHHLRELILNTYKKSKGAKDKDTAESLHLRSLQYLERYLYLILFNTYLHLEKPGTWKRTFKEWMTEVAAPAGVFEILDKLGFSEFEDPESTAMCRMRNRWQKQRGYKVPTFGEMI